MCKELTTPNTTYGQKTGKMPDIVFLLSYTGCRYPVSIPDGLKQLSIKDTVWQAQYTYPVKCLASCCCRTGIYEIRGIYFSLNFKQWLRSSYYWYRLYVVLYISHTRCQYTLPIYEIWGMRLTFWCRHQFPIYILQLKFFSKLLFSQLWPTSK